MRQMSKTNPWLGYYKPNAEADIRLFCFPYAGGGASSFREWAGGLPSSVDVCPVQLPGRGGRMSEKPFTRLSPLVEALAHALNPYFEMPFAFFGHSMGAVIGFELARHLRRKRLPEPEHLFVSGRCAPQTPDIGPFDFDLPEAEFIEELRRLNGTPKEVLEHPELMQLMLPLLRADFEAIQTYNYAAEAPLDCPITAFGGTRDKDISLADLEGWREQTRSSFTLKMFDGDHFFLHTTQTALLQTLSKHLRHHSFLTATV